MTKKDAAYDPPAQLAPDNLPSTEKRSGGNMNFEDYAGAGMENVTSDDLLVPRLGILQALSPELNKKKTEYIADTGIGDIADLGTGEIMPNPLVFLPVFFKKVWIEWAPRESGKGLVAIHVRDSCLDGTTRNERNQPVTSEGNYIAETHQFFGLNLSADRRRSYVSFTSTQIKKARKLNVLATSIRLARNDGTEYTPPLFYSSYNLGTAEESNPSGDWAGWTVNRGTRVEDMENWQYVLQDAKDFYAMLIKGEAVADVSQEGDHEEGQFASGRGGAM